jgi:hypothetical protein
VRPFGHSKDEANGPSLTSQPAFGIAENLLRACGSAAEQVRRERGGETLEDELKRLVGDKAYEESARARRDARLPVWPRWGARNPALHLRAREIHG